MTVLGAYCAKTPAPGPSAVAQNFSLIWSIRSWPLTGPLVFLVSTATLVAFHMSSWIEASDGQQLVVYQVEHREQVLDELSWVFLHGEMADVCHHRVSRAGDRFFRGLTEGDCS